MRVKLKEVCEILDHKRVPLSKKEREERTRNKSIDELYPYYGATQQAGYIDDYIFNETLILLGEDGVMFYDRTKPKAYLISGKSWVNNHAHVLKVKEDIAVINYVLYFLNVFDYHGFVSGSTRLKLNKSKMENIQIPLPPLTQQKKIAHTLDKAKELIELRKKSIEKLDALAKSLFVDMFGDPVENPMGWEVVKVNKVVSSIDSGWSPVCHSYERIGNQHGILKLSALSNDIYHSTENKAMKENIEPKIQHLVENDDLLFSRKNTYERVGSCAYVYETDENLYIPDLIFRLNCNDLISKVFLWKYLSNEVVKIRIRNIANGAAASMPNISKSKLLDFKIYLPPLPLQQKFANTIQKIESQKSLYEKELAKLEENFEALLAKSFG